MRRELQMNPQSPTTRSDRRQGSRPEVSLLNREAVSLRQADGGTDSDGTDGVHVAAYGDVPIGGDRNSAEHYEQLCQAGGFSSGQ